MDAAQLSVLFVGLLLGFGGQTNLVDWAKKFVGLDGSGMKAKLLAAAIAVVTAAGALLITGGLGIADFTLQNFPVVFAAVYLPAEFLFAYRKSLN